MANPNRVVRFELHIRPMFRQIDRNHMNWSFDAWDYDSVKAKSRPILARATVGDMPTLDSGGPWPQEWIALFNRWIQEGYQRLDLAVAATFRATRDANDIILEVQGEAPALGYSVWLDYKIDGNTSYEFVLYQEPPVGSSVNTPTPFNVSDTFTAPGSLTSIAVYDRNGRHDVPIT